jgi:uncharacterized protein (TIGR02246 family)
MASADSSDVESAIRDRSGTIVAAFDKGDADAIGGLFLPEGEMINEEGTVYRGRDEIVALMKDYFSRFPGSTLMMNVESVRGIGGGLAIEDGSRSIATKDGQSRADLRYSTVWSKSGENWMIASVREIADDAPPSAHSLLESLDWLVGEWVNEGDDAVVKVTYRWSEDGNYLLGDFDVHSSGRSSGKSSQRIGWDPVHRSIRSWIFDSDGGFSDGRWIPTETGWIIRSSAVLPDGQTGLAHVHITPLSLERFTIKGTNRLIGGVLDSDFEVTVTKRPPLPADNENSNGEASDAKK